MTATQLNSLGTIFVGIAVLILSLAAIFDRDDEPSAGIDTPMQITRELHCEEDEDILIALADNGLPIAWCEQRIPR